MKSKHDTIVDYLEERLEKAGYLVIEKDWQYDTKVDMKLLQGQVDILTWRFKSNYWHFYEVKCNDTPQNLIKAQSQYNRFKKAFTSERTKGVYYTPQRVRRLR